MSKLMLTGAGKSGGGAGAPITQNLVAWSADSTQWIELNASITQDNAVINPLTGDLGITRVTCDMTVADYHFADLINLVSPIPNKIANQSTADLHFCMWARVKAGTSNFMALGPFFQTDDVSESADIYCTANIATGELIDCGATQTTPGLIYNMEGFVMPAIGHAGWYDVIMRGQMNQGGAFEMSLDSTFWALCNSSGEMGGASTIFDGDGKYFEVAGASIAFTNHQVAFVETNEEGYDVGNPPLI